MIKWVIFDMDGVLFDTESLSKRIWGETGDKLGMPGMDIAIDGYYGLNTSDSRIRFAEEFPGSMGFDNWAALTNAAKDEWIDRNGVPLMRGVKEILALLKDAGIPAAVCTSSPRDMVTRYLSMAGIAGMFEKVVTGDSVTHGKPAPDIYLKACRALNADPEHSAAVEDSYNGLISAHTAGMKAIMVPDMKPYTDDIAPYVYAVCGDLGAVGELIMKENGGK